MKLRTRALLGAVVVCILWSVPAAAQTREEVIKILQGWPAIIQRVIELLNEPPNPGCTFTVAPTTASVPQGGGNTSFTVTASAQTCAWTASTTTVWLAVAPTSGTGNGSVVVTAQANTTTADRTGQATVAGQSVSVTQAAPTSQNGEPSEIFYPLEITNVKPAGTAGYQAGHFLYHAHPGVPWTHRAAVMGGSAPYPSFTLANAPADMTVDARGTIVWANPQGTVTPTLTVRDAAGATVSATWTLTAAPDRFRFVDANNGNDANDGSKDAPWRTWAKVYSSTTGSQIVYVRAGTYTVDNIPVQAANHSLGEEYILWSGTVRSAQWIGYPGDARPTIDIAYTGNGQPYSDGTSQPRFRINGPNLYVADLRFHRCMTMCFQVNHGGQSGTHFVRNVFDTSGPGIDGGNSAFIMTVAAGGANSLHTVIQDNEFKNLKHGTANSGLKLYTLTKPVIEDNTFHDFDNNGSEGIAVKSAIVQYAIRGNRFWNVGQGIVGNMDDYIGGDETRGEALFNSVVTRVLPAGGGTYALHFNQNGTARSSLFQRNTFVGPVIAFNVGSGDGPFRLARNVIVNSNTGTPTGSHVQHVSVTAPGQIILFENLAGLPSAGIVDAEGKLQNSYRTQWLGLRGAER